VVRLDLGMFFSPEARRFGRILAVGGEREAWARFNHPRTTCLAIRTRSALGSVVGCFDLAVRPTAASITTRTRERDRRRGIFSDRRDTAFIDACCCRNAPTILAAGGAGDARSGLRLRHEAFDAILRYIRYTMP